MKASAGTLWNHRVPAFPSLLKEAKEKVTREMMVEAGIITATVAGILFLSTALQMGLERYAIVAM